MPSNEVIRKRRRPALSCEQCRRRKIKCDRTHPCEYCALSGTDCTYAADKTNFGGRHLVSVFHQRIDSQSLTKAQSRPSETNSRSTTDTETTGPIEQLVYKTKVQTIRTDLPKVVHDSSYQRPCVSYPINGSSTGVVSKNRYYGQSHWMSCLPPSFDPIFNLWLDCEADPSSVVHKLFRKCKNTSRQIKARDMVPSPIAQHPSESFPDRETADSLLKSYLETFESIFRLLHVPSFLREYETFWLDPRTASDNLVTKLLLIMAIGAVFQSRDKAVLLRPSAIQWIYAAQVWLCTPFEKYRLTTDGIQIQCLVLLAKLAHDIDGDLLSSSAGHLIQSCMQMGLHIDADLFKFRDLPPEEIQLRRKLWATVLELVVLTSMDSGVPPLIRANDYECTAPLDADDIEQEEHRSDFLSTVQPPDRFTQCSLQIMLMKSLPLRLEAATFINNFRSESTTYDKTMSLTKEMMKAYSNDAASFQRYKRSSSYPTEFQIKMVELLTHRFLFALHYPFALKAKSEHIYYYSKKVCLDTAKLLVSNTLLTQEDTYTHLLLWGGGIFRGIPMQCYGFIMNETLDRMEVDSVSFTQNTALLNERDEFRQYVVDYLDLVMVRIKNGHTNVRAYTMFSALLAKLDASFEDASDRNDALTALESSLSLCYAVLQSLPGASVSQSDPIGSDMETQFGAGIAGANAMQYSTLASNTWPSIDNVDTMRWLFSFEDMDPMNWRQ